MAETQLTIKLNVPCKLNSVAPANPINAIPKNIDVIVISPLNLPYGKVCTLSHCSAPPIYITSTTGQSLRRAKVIRMPSVTLGDADATFVMFFESQNAIHP